MPTRRHQYSARSFASRVSLVIGMCVALGGCTKTDNQVKRVNSTGPVESSPVVRIAVFNASLTRDASAELAADLETGESAQGRNVAEVIQRTRPDVLVLQEFDHDAAQRALNIFVEQYLGRPQGGAEPIHYPHLFYPTVNTGLPTGLDLTRDGRTDSPGDCQGFGRHHGQYGMVVLSKYPLDIENVRTFQRFLWNDVPNALIPLDETQANGKWYSDEALSVQRLSSKTHFDLSVSIGTREIHLLVAHPTPPVFDGPEDRNGRRNHDEIRLFADYLEPDQSGYIVDDKGASGGLDDSESFIILGDLNADPVDGDSTNQAILQLLNHRRVNRRVAQGDLRPRSLGGAENDKRAGDKGDPAYDTAAWGLRVDYVLPSNDLTVHRSGVFWPPRAEPQAQLTQVNESGVASSDHRLVWVDLLVD